MTYQDVLDAAERLDLNVQMDSRALYDALVDEKTMEENMQYEDFLQYLSKIL